MKKTIVVSAIVLGIIVALFLLLRKSPNTLSQICRTHSKLVRAINENDRNALREFATLQGIDFNEDTLSANLKNWKIDVWEFGEDDVIHFLEKDNSAFVILPWRDGEHGVSAEKMPYKVYMYVKQNGVWLFESRYGIGPKMDNPTHDDWEDALFPDLTGVKEIRLEKP